MCRSDKCQATGARRACQYRASGELASEVLTRPSTPVSSDGRSDAARDHLSDMRRPAWY